MIELTQIYNNGPITILKNKIIFFDSAKEENRTFTKIYFGRDIWVNVEESYEKVKKLLEDKNN